MIPATLLSRALTATRRFAPTVLAASPGRLVISSADAWCQLESPQVVDTFRCREIGSLSNFVSGLRRPVEVVSDGQQTILRASGRRLVVEPLPVLVGRAPDSRSSPCADSAFAIRVSRQRLEEAVERFARKDGECLLHYTHDSLCLDDELCSSSISNRRRSAGPQRVARAVSGQLLRRVAMALRTDDLELRILGEWNGAGPVVLSECVDGTRLTIVIRGDSYRRVRHLVLRIPQEMESIYTGATQQECEGLAAYDERERTAEWVQTREWDLYRLREMAEDQDRRSERAELLEHLEWEAKKHRRHFTDGCGLVDCDVCAVKPP
jgi:hypothetical protein